MNDDLASDDLIDELVDEFLSRKQAGESPSISDYCARFPQLATEIRELFPTLAVLEEVNPCSDETEFDFSALPDAIGSYQILREIGRGGMGVVYEAHHAELKRHVALKVLPRRLSLDARAIARFQREARAIAKLHHSNIVPLFEVGEDNGRFFLAMQLISGRSLDKAISDAASFDSSTISTKADDARAATSTGESSTTISLKLSATLADSTISESGSGSNRHRVFRAIARMGMQVADALAYSHHRGIIHRDVKPSNILLDESGVTWLTDFGLAKMEDEELTQTGDFVGTLRYMAPERFRNECDERADIYGLGLTLYELLTLEPAFQSSDRLELIDVIGRSSPTGIRLRNPRVPRDLETIVMKAIDRDPRLRYATAKAMADDLRRFMNDQPIKARRHSWAERLMRWSRRNRGLAASLAATALLLITVAVGATLTSIRMNKLRVNAEETSVQLQRNLYYSQMNAAAEASNKRAGSETIKSILNEWLPVNAGTDLRGWEWYYLFSLSHRERFVSQRQSYWTWDAGFSPDGKHVVNAVSGNGFQIRDAETGVIQHHVQTGSARSVEWSPDGQRIAGSGFGGEICVFEANTVELIHRIDTDLDEPIECVRWSPDGSKLASCQANHYAVEIWDAATGEHIRSLRPNSETRIQCVRWSPNGKQVAAVVYNEICVWNSETGDVETTLGGGDHGRMLCMCWSPDGAQIATGGKLCIWEVDSGEETTKTSLAANTMCWIPDKNRIAYGGWEGVLHQFDVESGENSTRFYGHTAEIFAISCAEDSSALVSASKDHTVRTWDLDSTDLTRSISAYRDSPSSHAGPLGERIAWATARDYVSYWNAESGRTIHRRFEDVPDLIGTTGNIPRSDCVAMNADGTRLAISGRMDAVLVWDIDTDQLSKCEGKVKRTALLDWYENERLASLSHMESELCIWDASGKRLAGPVKLHPGMSGGLDWSPDGTKLASSSATDNRVKVWDAATLELIWEREIDDLRIDCVQWNSDGQMLATTHLGAIVLWDASNGEVIRKLDELRENFSRLAWSPDDKRLAVSSSASLSIWDVDHGRLAIKLPAYLSAKWSDDGRRLVAGSGTTVQIFDATRGYVAEKVEK